MTNCEKFNAVLNSCQNPRAVYDALFALARAGMLGKFRKGETG